MWNRIIGHLIEGPHGFGHTPTLLYSMFVNHQHKKFKLFHEDQIKKAQTSRVLAVV